MQVMGIQAIYPKHKTSVADKTHKIYLYLLRGVKIAHPNHVWSIDITYVPMPSGFMYLCAIIDWYSSMIVAWSLSNTMSVEFCVETLDMALCSYGI